MRRFSWLGLIILLVLFGISWTDSTRANSPDLPFKASIPGVARDAGEPAPAAGTDITAFLAPLTPALLAGDVDAENQLSRWMRAELTLPGNGARDAAGFDAMDAALANLLASFQEHEAAAANESGSGRGVLRSFQFASLGRVGGVLAGFPTLFGGEKPGQGPLPPANYEATTDGVSVRISMTPTVTGSTLDGAVTVTLGTTRNGVQYEEEASGKIHLNFCPDANGDVPLTLSLAGGAGVGEVSGTWKFDFEFTGHVNDDANLAGVDVSQKGAVGVHGGPGKNKYVEWSVAYGVTGLDTNSPSTNGVTADQTRRSSDADSRFVGSAVKLGDSLALALGVLSLRSAQNLWQDGRCVEILAPTPNDVAPNSATSFEARLSHKVDGTELHTGITAVLAGEVSVAPTGVPIPAPATFVYTAPDTPPDAGGTATVALESRSRRGIAKLDVVFNIARPYVWFKATLTMKPPGTSPETYEAIAIKVPVFVNQPAKVGEGAITMDVVDAWWQHMNGCTAAVAKGDGTFKVIAAVEDETGFRMWIEAGDPSIQPTFTCRDKHGRVTIVSTLPARSMGDWWRSPNAYGPPLPGGYELTGWQRGEPGILQLQGTKTWAVQDGELTIEWEIVFHGAAGVANP